MMHVHPYVRDFYKPLAGYYDENYFVGVKHPLIGIEGGDSAQRIAVMAYAFYVTNPHARGEYAEFLLKQLDMLLISTTDSNKPEKIKYQYVRHPNKDLWYGQPWNMSRDNFYHLWGAAGLYAPYHPRVREHYWLMTKISRKRSSSGSRR